MATNSRYDPFCKRLREYKTFPEIIIEGTDYYEWFYGDKHATHYHDYGRHDEVIAGVKGVDWMYLKDTIPLKDLPENVQFAFQ